MAQIPLQLLFQHQHHKRHGNSLIRDALDDRQMLLMRRERDIVAFMCHASSLAGFLELQVAAIT